LIEKSRLPIVTLILIVANMVAAFAVASTVEPGASTSELVMDFGFNSKNPSLLTAFTSLFLHQNLFHLLGNMVFLAAVGASVELATGSGRFLIVYLVSGFVGVVVHFVFTAPLRDPSILVGASGAVAGCAGYYSVRYVRLKVPVAPRKGISVAVITAIWLALQLVGAFVHIGSASASVAFWAHIGGFLSGLILCAIFRAPDLGQRKLGHEVLDQMNERGPAAMALAAKQHLKEHPGDVKALRDLVEAEKQLGHPDAEVATLFKLLELLPETEQGDPLHRLAELEKLQTLPSVRRTLLADRFSESDKTLARKLLKSVVDGPDSDPQIPDAMLALASLEFSEDPDLAKEILRRLEAKFPLHPTVNLARHRGWIA
jgi:membrane associated rhomboid family serine protease